MKIGVCCKPELSATYAGFGFDFVEWAVASNVGTADDAAFTALQDLTASLTVTPEAWNVLLPGEIKVVGPDADPSSLTAYLDVVLPRVRRLGGEVIVFGSGRSRTIPDGFDPDSAHRQFAEACRIVAQAAAAHDIVIALEPLRTGETNLVNRVDEGAALVRAIDEPSFRLLADHYHMLDNGEDEAVVGEVSDLLAHVHIASRDRFVPIEEADVTILRRFLSQLEQSGYDGRISFETRTDDPAIYGRGLQVVREAWEAA